LLLIELVLVMRLSTEETMRKSTRLALAAALMIILGYPGEIAEDNGTRALWGTLSSIPFAYIVYELFVGLGDAIKRQPENARRLVNTARWLTFASWGFYPIVYMVPYTSMSGSSTETHSRSAIQLPISSRRPASACSSISSRSASRRSNMAMTGTCTLPVSQPRPRSGND